MKEVHVSSLMLYVAREDLNSVAESVKACQGADLVRIDRDEGRLTAVLETDSMTGVRMAMRALERLDGVAQVVLLFHNMINTNVKESITA